MNDLMAILNSGLTMGMIFIPCTLAMMIALRLVDFPDLSIEGSFPLGAALTAVFIKSGYPVGLALTCALMGGIASGIMTGVIHEKLKVSKLLSGIIVLTMLYSINLRIMGGSNLSLLGEDTLFSLWEKIDYNLSEKFGWSIMSLGKNSFLLFISLVTAFISFFILKSRVGLRLQAAGSNRVFTDRMGFRSQLYIIVTLAGTNLLSSFSGGLLAMHQGFADVAIGQGVLIISLASLAVGEKTAGLINWKSRIPFLIISAFLGSIIYQTLIAGAIRAGLAASDLKIATAILVLLAVAFHFYRKRDTLEQHGY